MKKRVVAILLVLMCAASLLVAPAQAYAPPNDDSGISAQADTVRWYYRMNNGVMEMRLWSITQGRWLTDWVPVPTPNFTY